MGRQSRVLIDNTESTNIQRTQKYQHLTINVGTAWTNKIIKSLIYIYYLLPREKTNVLSSLNIRLTVNMYILSGSRNHGTYVLLDGNSYMLRTHEGK